MHIFYLRKVNLYFLLWNRLGEKKKWIKSSFEIQWDILDMPSSHTSSLLHRSPQVRHPWEVAPSASLSRHFGKRGWHKAPILPHCYQKAHRKHQLLFGITWVPWAVSEHLSTLAFDQGVICVKLPSFPKIPPFHTGVSPSTASGFIHEHQPVVFIDCEGCKAAYSKGSK